MSTYFATVNRQNAGPSTLKGNDPFIITAYPINESSVFDQTIYGGSSFPSFGAIDDTYVTSGIPSGTIALIDDQHIAVPIIIPAGSFNRIGVSVSTTDADSSVELGLYNNADCAPSTKIVSGTTNTTTTGDKEIEIDQEITEGVYWLALKATGTPVLRGALSTYNLHYTGTDKFLVYTGISDSALAATWTISRQGLSIIPKIWIRNNTGNVINPEFIQVTPNLQTTFPAGIEAGQLLIRAVVSTTATHTPAGFTNVADGISPARHWRVSKKIADGTESGTIGGTGNVQSWLIVVSNATNVVANCADGGAPPITLTGRSLVFVTLDPEDALGGSSSYAGHTSLTADGFFRRVVVDNEFRDFGIFDPSVTADAQCISIGVS